MVTSWGIYLDLTESVYVTKVNNLVFYFSSEFYKKKFDYDFKTFVSKETSKLIARYGFKVDFENYLLIILYSQIEKRGFRIYNDYTKEFLEKDKIVFRTKVGD